MNCDLVEVIHVQLRAMDDRIVVEPVRARLSATDEWRLLRSTRGTYLFADGEHFLALAGKIYRGANWMVSEQVPRLRRKGWEESPRLCSRPESCSFAGMNDMAVRCPSWGLAPIHIPLSCSPRVRRKLGKPRARQMRCHRIHAREECSR
jgi:hypothetical protein